LLIAYGRPGDRSASDEFRFLALRELGEALAYACSVDRMMCFFLTALLLGVSLEFQSNAVSGAASGQVNVAAKDHWSFQAPTAPVIPNVKNRAWPRTDIDRFLLAKLEASDLQPLGRANKLTLIRRATYDLTGLPPTPGEIDAFLNDNSPQAFAAVVNRLLASPRYGERWGRHWLDVVRYADTAGETADFPVDEAWRYRNYVIDAFNRDTPFDQFIREQLAGDILARADESISPDRYAELITATGYLAISRRHGFDARKDHYLTIEDTIDTLGKSFLGLTIACARCHDHKYDPISARDYYGLYGIFASTRYSFPGSESSGQATDMVPLTNSMELLGRVEVWNKKKTELEKQIGEAKKQLAGVSGDFKKLASQPGTPLDQGQIDAGSEQPFTADEVTVKRGDMLQLIIDPRDGDYGSDTTIIEWELSELGGEGRRWNVTGDVVDDFLVGNPHPDKLGNRYTWAFLDARKPGQLLKEPVTDNEGRKGNHVWRVNPLPSVFVNANETPLKAWTTLPPRTLFVHPASDGPVGIGWTSPIDGNVKIRGLVKDGHPGGNGVAWHLVQLTGDFLTALAKPGETMQTLQVSEKKLAALMENQVKIAHAYGAVEDRIINEKLHKRGDPKMAGDEVPRKNIDLLGGQKVTEGSGRMQLANWIANTANPLTSRVIVNRIWLHHFGRGLVSTPNDFGIQGQAPTHPGLLDWLAVTFVQSGWSIKGLHRLIMNSASYQTAVAAGPEQTLYGSFRPRRLSAEELRDTLLALGQALDCSTPAGHPFPEKRQFTQHTPFRANYENKHRSVFLMTQRIQRRPIMALFDGADSNASTGQRRLSNVPAQALYFMNNELMHAQAAALAKRLAKLSPDSAKRIQRAHLLALGRPVTEREVADAAKFITEYSAVADEAKAWATWCRVLLSSNEFLYVN